MENLHKLCCGDLTSSSGRIYEVLSILGKVITRHERKALSIIKDGSDEDKSMYGSFVARKLIESASSAILARMDPSRFLILQEYQQRAGANYSAHERHPASITWSGDIIPVSPANAVWNTESDRDKFIRALLGGHLAEVSWPKAIEGFSQDVSDRSKGLWIEELSSIYEQKLQQSEAKPARKQVAQEGAPQLENLNPTVSNSGAVGTSVLGVFRGRAQDCYSALSKGVHLEFVVDETIVLDPDTVVQHMLNAIKLMSQLGYLSSYMDSVYTRTEPRTAAELLLNIEESFT